MKRPINNPGIILPIIIISIFIGLQAAAQALPEVAVRFANPRYNCETELYCVDVELKSDTPDKQLFGFNIRFFFEGALLQHHSTGDFVPGYELVNQAIETGLPGSGPLLFDLNDPLRWYNGFVQLTDPFANPTYISTTNWTRIFSVCFKVIGPAGKSNPEFCPPLVWDLTENIDPEIGERIGYLPGDDGVTITLVGSPDSEPSTEDVVQFNWSYGDDQSYPVGAPNPVICIDTRCGTPLPLSDWAIYLAIGLMVVVTVVIYQRRISA